MELPVNETTFGVAEVCRDRLGRSVPVGEYFVPGDPCRTCLCDGGVAVACAVMQCSQPDCDRWQHIEGECCLVKCLQGSANSSTDSTSFSEISEELSMALRLLASSTTFLLLVIVLIYIVCHFWRQCLSFFICRVECREHDVDYLHHREDASSDVCRNDRIDMSISLPSFDAETPPPPYTPAKVTCMLPTYEEAPPPYESMSVSQSLETVTVEQDTIDSE